MAGIIIILYTRVYHLFLRHTSGICDHSEAHCSIEILKNEANADDNYRNFSHNILQ